MISFQIGFYANTSQRPILKEIGLILNKKTREWINIRSTTEVDTYTLLSISRHERKKTTTVQ